MPDFTPGATSMVMAGAQRLPTALNRSMAVGAAAMSMSATKVALHPLDPRHLGARLTINVSALTAPSRDTLQRLCLCEVTIGIVLKKIGDQASVRQRRRRSSCA
jgi:hypothetical protein